MPMTEVLAMEWTNFKAPRVRIPSTEHKEAIAVKQVGARREFHS